MPHRLGLLLLAGLLVSLAAADRLDQLLEKARQATTATCRFTQSTHLRSEDPAAGETYAGVLYLAKPDRYDLTYTKPDDDEYTLRFLSDGTTTWKVEQLFAHLDADVTSAPVAEGGGPARHLALLLQGDRAALETDFTLTTREAEGDGLILVLAPRDADIAARLAGIEVDLTADGAITTLRIDEAGPNRITITVLELTYDAPQPDDLYSWKTP